MALAATDGFDMYNGVGVNTGVQAKWPFYNGTTNVSTTTGRFAGQALRFASVFGGKYWGRNFTASRTSGANGFAFRYSAASNIDIKPHFGVVSNGLPQFGFYVNGSGGFVCGRAGSGFGQGVAAVLGTTAPGLISANTWYYLEIEWVLSATVGAVNFYIEGTLVLSLTGVNNMAQTGVGYTNGDAWFIGGGAATGSMDYDDYYEADTNTKVGTMRIDPIRPASDNSVTWTPNSGANNYSRVNETLVDGDTSYVSSATPGQQDLYTVSALPVVPATIYGVQRVDFARKTDANPRTIYQTVKSGVTTDQGTAKSLVTDYARLERMLLVDPNTSAAWTPSAISALLIGPNLAS